VETLRDDVRLALRAILRNPSFALTAVLTLALGIGATTAIFSVVNGILFRPLPYSHPEQLMVLWHNNTREGIERDITSYPNFLDWRQRARSFAHMATYRMGSATITEGGEPEQIPSAIASIDFFATMGTSPLVGRAFSADEFRPASANVAVLSYGLWQRRFGGTPDITERTIQLGGNSYRIVGVMPQRFDYPEGVQLWLPLAETEQMLSPGARGGLSYYVIGRLQAGVDPLRVRQETDRVAAELAQEYPRANTGSGIRVEPLHTTIVGDLRSPLLILLSAVVLVLLIGCANVANLLLARGAVRRKEFAIRAALGAGGWRVARQMMTESIVLALAGGALGIAFAIGAVSALVRMAPAELPRTSDIGVDLQVLVFAVIISVATGLLFGMAPLLQARKAHLMHTLREGGRDTSATESLGRLRPALIGAEVAIALVLLVGASLLIRTLAAITAVQPGFDEHNVVTFRVSLPGTRYATDDEVVNFHHSLEERISGLPGVAEVGAISTLFLSRLPTMAPISVEGVQPRGTAEAIESVPYDATSESFFDAMRIPLVSGRSFNATDRSGSTPTVLVNQAFVRRYFPSGDAVGKRFTFGSGTGANVQWLEIVGVVADAHRSGLMQPLRPEAYFPHSQYQTRALTYVVRANADPLALVGPIRSTVRELDPLLPVSQAQTLERSLSDSLAARRFIMTLLTGFALLALVLSAIGIYGVIAYLVAQRRRELGIRLALGAHPGRVIRLIVMQSLRHVVPGVVIGGVAALVLSRFLRAQLFGIAPTDALAFAVAAGTLLTACVLASLVPALRAARTDPLIALRSE
jgi:predicted permease